MNRNHLFVQLADLGGRSKALRERAADINLKIAINDFEYIHDGFEQLKQAALTTPGFAAEQYIAQIKEIRYDIQEARYTLIKRAVHLESVVRSIGLICAAIDAVTKQVFGIQVAAPIFEAAVNTRKAFQDAEVVASLFDQRSDQASTPKRINSDEEFGVGITVSAIPDDHLEAYQVTEDGRVRHRWFPDGGKDQWSSWTDFGFTHGRARDVASVSARRDHIAIFILAEDGQVWRRYWTRTKGWSDFFLFGRPYPPESARAITASSLRHNHMDVLVEARNKTVCHKWAIDGKWYEAGPLDGWYPIDGE